MRSLGAPERSWAPTSDRPRAIRKAPSTSRPRSTRVIVALGHWQRSAKTSSTTKMNADAVTPD